MRYSNYSRGSGKVWLTILGACLALLVPKAFAAAPEITVLRNLVNINDGDTTPSAADGTDFGSEREHQFSIYNEGTADLNLSSVTITGAHASDFGVVFFNTNLQAGYMGTMLLVFHPSAPGTRTAMVNIANNDSNENPFNFAIQGAAPVHPVIHGVRVSDACVGSRALVAVEATGFNVTFQWQRRAPGTANFVDIVGATAVAYLTPPLTTADDQTGFRAVLKSGSSTTNSGEALLAVFEISAPAVVYSFTDSNLGNATVYGNAAPTNNALRLNRPQAGETGAFLLPVLAPNERVYGFIATFKVRITEDNLFADGFSFNWATDLPEGVYAQAEEGEGSGLRVCFDTYNNGGFDGPAIDVKWGTNIIASHFTHNGFLAPGDFADVAIRLNPNGTLDLTYRCVSIFAGLPLPGYKSQVNARFGLGARTGMNYSTHTIDDLAIELDSVAPIVDASVPGDTIVATSANSPAAQAALKAIDNNATNKYLNFDKLNTGMTITPTGQRPVRALTLISAEDVPDRDPSSFVLEGSNDGTNFTRIASNAVPAFPTRHFIRSVAFANTNVFDHYRVLFPTVSNAATANSMQIAEVELLHHDEITSTNDAVSITLPPGAVDVRGVGALFDRQLDGIRKLEIAPITNNNTIVNITLAAGAKVLKGFELIGAADDFTFPQRRPSSVVVAGSDDGVNYTNLATVIPAAPSSNLQIQEFSTASNITPYARYRITFGPPAGGNRIQVGEMRLFGEVIGVIPTLTIRASGTNAVVSWPDVFGFNLETKTDPSGSGWTPIAHTPALSNGVKTVRLPTSETSAFFRLRK